MKEEDRRRKADGGTKMNQVGSRPESGHSHFQGVQTYRNSLNHIKIIKETDFIV